MAIYLICQVNVTWGKTGFHQQSRTPCARAAVHTIAQDAKANALEGLVSLSFSLEGPISFSSSLQGTVSFFLLDITLERSEFVLDTVTDGNPIPDPLIFTSIGDLVTHSLLPVWPWMDMDRTEPCKAFSRHFTIKRLALYPPCTPVVDEWVPMLSVLAFIYSRNQTC